VTFSHHVSYAENNMQQFYKNIVVSVSNEYSTRIPKERRQKDSRISYISNGYTLATDSPFFMGW